MGEKIRVRVFPGMERFICVRWWYALSNMVVVGETAARHGTTLPDLSSHDNKKD